MRLRFKVLLAFIAAFLALLVLHLPLLRLPYFWDESGYYIPAALDFYSSWLLIPQSTQPIGHTPLVMIYLGLAWRLLGYSTWITRVAMTLVATATVATLYVLGRRIANPESAAWSALLLALSPLFFAQTTLAHLDLPAALFTTLAVLCILEDKLWLFALTASLAVLTKETTVVLLPVVWLDTWRRAKGPGSDRPAHLFSRILLVIPLVPLAVWTVYYHHVTGFWTGNRGYLSYNLYATLSPPRVFWSLLRRAYALFLGAFNWILTACATIGLWWERKHCNQHSSPRGAGPVWQHFVLLAAGLAVTYLLLLSVVGGAILTRYLLPIFPLFYLGTVSMVRRLPKFTARLILIITSACFVWAWFINPPYPFPFEDNLAYRDFIRLHQQAAGLLEEQPGQPRILTAWPATGELTSPFLGYVHKPLRVVAVPDFALPEINAVPPESFDLLYLYSRRWELPGNWLERYPFWLRIQSRYFNYAPQAAAETVASHYHLHLVAEMERRGQWVRIYSR